MPKLDMVIHKHLDEMDKLEKSINDEIDQLMKDLNMDMVIEDPRTAINALINIIHDEVIMPKMKKALALGEEFALAIKKDGEVVIQETKNAEVNQGVIDAIGRD